MRWHSKQLSYPDDPLGQARIFLFLDPYYLPDQHRCHLSMMEENTYVGINLIRGSYVKDTCR